jgi:hypothetical protein
VDMHARLTSLLLSRQSLTSSSACLNSTTDYVNFGTKFYIAKHKMDYI